MISMTRWYIETYAYQIVEADSEDEAQEIAWANPLDWQVDGDIIRIEDHGD